VATHLQVAIYVGTTRISIATHFSAGITQSNNDAHKIAVSAKPPRPYSSPNENTTNIAHLLKLTAIFSHTTVVSTGNTTVVSTGNTTVVSTGNTTRTDVPFHEELRAACYHSV
jgi:hypothetical protein